MTERQKLFVEEYLVDLNATQAAIRAGYSPNTANEQGSRLLANVSIRACIDKALAERSKRTGINQDRVLQELAKLAFVNPKNIINFEEATVKEDAADDDLVCIQSVRLKTMSSDKGDMLEREVKLYDKKGALELLGRHLGMFKDKLEIEGTEKVVIVDDIPRTEKG